MIERLSENWQYNEWPDVDINGNVIPKRAKKLAESYKKVYLTESDNESTVQNEILNILKSAEGKDAEETAKLIYDYLVDNGTASAASGESDQREISEGIFGPKEHERIYPREAGTNGDRNVEFTIFDEKGKKVWGQSFTMGEHELNISEKIRKLALEFKNSPFSRKYFELSDRKKKQWTFDFLSNPRQTSDRKDKPLPTTVPDILGGEDTIARVTLEIYDHKGMRQFSKIVKEKPGEDAGQILSNYIYKNKDDSDVRELLYAYRKCNQDDQRDWTYTRKSNPEDRQRDTRSKQRLSLSKIRL